MKTVRYILLLGIISIFSINSVSAQKTNDADEGYVFTDDFSIDVTSVKNQYRSGTCWSFLGLSFLEAELIRLKKGEFDLSEMFVVYHCYKDKADRYVRMHGHLNFGGGGAFHDVTYVLKHYGMVPEDAYHGLNYDTEKHVHGELDNVLTKYVKAVVENKNKKLTRV